MYPACNHRFPGALAPSVRCLRGSPCSVTVDTIAAFDPEKLSVIEGFRLRRGVHPYPA